MKPRLTLKQQIVFTYILLACAIAGAFSVVSFVSINIIENQVIHTRLQKLATEFISSPHTTLNNDIITDPDLLIDTHIPTELSQLPDGFHKLRINHKQVHALLREHEGHRYAIIQDLGELEYTEQVIFIALLIGFMSSVILAIALGFWSSRRIIAPVASLADAVSRNAAPTALPSLKAQDEIGVLSRAFAKRTDKLQQFLARERLFTGDVSHELRTPLTVILGAAELLTSTLNAQSGQYAAAERIRRVAAETAQRVSALLLLARPADQHAAPLTVLNPIIDSEIERCKTLLHGKVVAWQRDDNHPVSISVHPELAGIVIGNLLRNACRHTDEGYIRIELTPQYLLIEDTGSGIPEPIQARLFQRFVHGSEQPEHQGMGLGLSIVKRVTEHVGWRIELQPTTHSGTRFVVFFN